MGVYTFINSDSFAFESSSIIFTNLSVIFCTLSSASFTTSSLRPNTIRERQFHSMNQWVCLFNSIQVRRNLKSLTALLPSRPEISFKMSLLIFRSATFPSSASLPTVFTISYTYSRQIVNFISAPHQNFKSNQVLLQIEYKNVLTFRRSFVS